MVGYVRWNGWNGCGTAETKTAVPPKRQHQALRQPDSQLPPGGGTGGTADYVPIADAGTGAHTHTHACVRDRCSNSRSTRSTLVFSDRNSAMSRCIGGLGGTAEGHPSRSTAVPAVPLDFCRGCVA